MSKTKGKFLAVLVIILSTVAGWSFYAFLDQGLHDLLLMWGIESFYLRTGVIFGSVLLILVLIGLGFAKAFNKVVKE